MEIKTIKRQLDASEEFDKVVNQALAEGWTLIKRDVLAPYEGTTRTYYRMLYAELEKR